MDKTTIKAAIITAIITGIFGIIGSIITACIGAQYGEKDAIIQVNAQVESGIDENENLSINNVNTLIEEYNKLVAENDNLREQNTQHSNELKEVKDELDQSNNKIEQLSNEVEQSNNEIKRLNEEIESFPSIEFSNISLSIDGTNIPIDSSNSSVVINERTYYVDDFIKRILSPNTMSIKDNTMYIDKTGGADNPIPPTETVSIFDLETFQGESRWYHNWSDSELTDTYGNEYPNGRYTNHRSDNKYTPTYLLDYKYSKCEGKVAWSKEEKNTSGSCWIDFYSGDTLIYSTDPISATDRPLSFEFSVENVETLKIVCKANLSRTVSVPIIYEYLNLVP